MSPLKHTARTVAEGTAVVAVVGLGRVGFFGAVRRRTPVLDNVVDRIAA